MSMTSMLGKMIVAGLVAKGVGKVAGGRSGATGSGGGIAAALGGLLGGNKSSASGGGGIAGALGGLFGGNKSSGGNVGNISAGGNGGDIASVLGGLLGGKQGGSGGLGGLLNGLAGGSSSQQGGGIGDILGSFIGDPQQTSQIQPTVDQERQAEILLRAMLNAAKSDGQIDKAEQARIVEHLGDVSEEERRFVQEVMSEPFDANAFIHSIPKGMEQQVYLMSLTSIDLDSKNEAQYLHQLAQGLHISQQACNNIHQQAGAPVLYS